jgi:hypothetical protein
VDSEESSTPAQDERIMVTSEATRQPLSSPQPSAL